jgi:UDP:flavonoid glycosyltransferase YjiC (YdhE family)
MARVLAYTSPARGHLYPLTPILVELRRRRHEVALRAMPSQVPLMRELGFDATSIDEHIEAIAHDDWQTSSQRAALGRSVATFLARARYDGPDLVKAVAEVPS